MNRVPCFPAVRGTSVPLRSTRRTLRAVLARTLVPCALLACALPAAAQDSPLRYARASASGAKLYNLPDRSSIAIGSVPEKTLLEVYSERAGFLSVDVPSGIEVWVYGEYVQPTSLPGTVEITGDNVFMRPVPKGDTSAYPLEQRLHKGDRVRAVGRNDASKPLAKDWVKIVTPPGTRAWIAAADTTAVPAGEDVSAAWNEAAKSGRNARAAFDVATGAAVASGDAATGAGTTGAGTTEKGVAAAGAPAGDASFNAAEKMYESARTTPGADWASVRIAYEKYLDKNPEGPFAPQARTRLAQIEVHAEIEQIRNDRSLRDAQRGDKLAEAERRLREANVARDPLQGRFQARGYLVKEQPAEGQPPRYTVFWAGKPSFEIVCTSGRYDLSVFDQYEVGVQGAIVRSAVQETETVAARPGRIDAARIEVLSARIPR